MNLVVRDDHRAPPSGCGRHRHAHGRGQVGRAVGAGRGGVALGDGKAHRLVGLQHEINQEACFFYGVGAVRDDGPGDLRVCEHRLQPLRQREHHRGGHIPACHCGERLAGHGRIVGYRGHGGNQLGGVNRRPDGAGPWIGPTGNRTTGGDEPHARRPIRCSGHSAVSLGVRALAPQ